MGSKTQATEKALKPLSLLWLIAALLLMPAWVWATTQVEQITGTGRLVRQGVGLPLAAGDDLRPGDQIEMDANGEALIRFSNGVKLIVRRGAQVALDELPTETRDSTVQQLLRGALRYANTKVRELSSRRTRIQTPSGHFGVRATDFDLVHLDQAQGPLVPAGTYVFVRDGLVEADVGGRVAEVGALQTALPQAGGSAAGPHHCRRGGEPGFCFQGPSMMLLLVVAAIPVAVVGAYLLIRYPPMGFLLIIVISTVISRDVAPVGLIAMLLAALTVLWIFDMMVRQREINLIKSPTITPLVLFSAVVVLSFVVGQLPWFSVSQVPMDSQIAGLGIFLLSFAAFILVAHQIRDIIWLKWMVFIYLALGSLAVIIGMRVLPAYQTLNYMLLHPKTTGGSLFWLWLSAMAFSQILFNKNLGMKWRVALVTSLA